MTNILGPIKK